MARPGTSVPVHPTLSSKSRADIPDCQFCARPASAQLPFCCAACARNSLYEARLKNAQMLLHKEALGREVERAIKDGAAPKLTTEGGPARIAHDVARAGRAEAKIRMRATEGQVVEIGQEVEAVRGEIERRKRDLERRRRILEEASGDRGILRTEARKDPVRASIGKTEGRGEGLLRKTVHARTYVCEQTAKLYGLQRKKRRKGPVEKDVFYIFGLPIVDLQDLFNAKVEPLNASLVNIAYLLNQTASYLSLRLPAELFLPSAEHAEPQILAPFSSHRQPSIPPLKKTLSSSSHSATDAAAQAWAPSRPRSLHLNRPLSKLVSEDSIAYESFVEAISLLAYNVAWLCKTQGMDICSDSWEEACHIGRNLWLLFSEKGDSRTRILRHLLGDHWQEEAAEVNLGAFSHGTHKNFAAGVEGDVIGFKTWRLGNATQLIKKVKDVLLERKMGAEWEILEEEAWGADEDIVGNGAVKSPGESGFQTDTDAEKAGEEKGSKGWMRIRSRNGTQGPS